MSPQCGKSVLVVGSIAYDDISTPTKSGERLLGGSASYASIAASYYTSCRLVGVVGQDFSNDDISRFKARGICLDGLKIDKTAPTFYWKGKYHENYNKRDTLAIELNAFEKFNPDLPQSYKNTPYVMLGNISPELQHRVCDQLNNKSFVLADTINLWIDTAYNELLALLKRIDCFVINDDEATQITQETNLIKAGKKLIELGPKMAIIKKGEHGAYLFHPEGIFSIPAYPVIYLEDPTGAGDSFAGALIGYLASVNSSSFASIKQAMIYATVTASLTVEAFSCNRLESAGINAIKARYKELVKMITL
jgi:cytidine kinase